MSKNLSALKQPLRLGRVTAKNRVWESPLWTRTASVQGEVTEKTIEHYASRAKGGAGVITTEALAVDGNHVWTKPQIAIWDENFGPGLRRLVESVHMHDSLIVGQLQHPGMFGTDPVSPSGVPCQDLGKLGHFIQPKVLTVNEIEDIRDKFINAAALAKACGFDGVEIHGATSYLLQQFFSGYNNKRTDKYGGTRERRIQLALEIVRGIREKCGPDYVIGYTVGESDLIPGGITREDVLVLAKALEKAGLTYLDLQADGAYETLHSTKCHGGYRRQPKGMFEKAVNYKKILNIPVTCRTAGEYDPEIWNEAIGNGKADVIRLGKQIIADENACAKAIKGNVEDIRPCIKCGNCIVSGEMMDWQLSCTVNPNVGKNKNPLIPAYVPKKVLVIGGGPAGLEAARVAALRGHSVTLLEKNSSVGGNLYIASLPIGKETLGSFCGWAERQCTKLGVDIRLNTEGTVEMVEEMKPDAIIVATGSRPLVPGIPGIKQPHVVTAEDVLLGKVTVGEKVVVAGAGEVGIETADLIMQKGMAKELTIVEMQSKVGADMSGIDLAMLFANEEIFPTHFKNGLQIKTDTKIEEITENGVIVAGNSWDRYEIEADTVVLALGYTSTNKIFKDLEERISEIYCIGDARRARRAWEAIHEANYFAREI
ncbi:FAD-dependent oxidoreductase [Oceanirhabdus seepicola]|uniref:FAD-dependent oxidoreductase n=1 Tax=Oceanirhabdus seepicola TaxID=2828781 RepID=A0A9J6P538_9CLOT|nr:FAD-dependent oxidoreductase [Oceanirhabdus seepicola]MCM1991356.1 FAD-dependent oxidoreductase [Oceanirhabdus seepicola]